MATSTSELFSQARRLESEIDARLAAYSKIGDAITLAATSSASSAPDPSEAHAKAAEIEGLLQQLAEVNEGMAARTTSAGHSLDVKNHTLVRHQNILIEYTREFGRTRAAVSASLERAQLLGAYGGSKGASRSAEGSYALSEAALLMSERNSIHSAISQVDDVIKQAQATSASLTQQRATLGGALSRLGTITSRIPGLNSLLGAIKRKKSRDNIILSAVVAACTIVMVIYWLNKK